MDIFVRFKVCCFQCFGGNKPGFEEVYSFWLRVFGASRDNSVLGETNNQSMSWFLRVA